MGFLAPAFLALAAFAGVPLLVHLLRRRITRTVDFPAVQYLARMEREHSRDIRLRNRLLLFLRIAAVLAVALAAARPLLRGAGFGHAPVALAIVLDNSMSSGAVRDGVRTLDSLRAAARSVLGDLTSADRAWLVTADGRVLGGPPDALQRGLAAVEPLGGRGDLTMAVTRALGLVRSGAPRTPVVALVSDGQASSLRGDSLMAADRIPVVALLRGTLPPANRAVVSARATPVRWTPSGAVTFSIVTQDTTPWRLVLDGRTVARGTTSPSGTSGADAIVAKLSSTGRGWLRGAVELEADALRADDARPFAVRIAPPPAVSVRGDVGPFLAAGIATLVTEGRLARAGAGEATPVTVGRADADLPAGPLFLTAPADPIRIGEANRQLARRGIPWRFGAIARDQVLSRIADRTVAAGGDSTSPTRAAFEGTAVRLRYGLQYSPPAGSAGAKAGATGVDTVALAGGTPWVVAGDGYVLIGSPIDPDATELPLRAAFVPWLLEAVTRRLGDEGWYRELPPGGRLTVGRDATGLEHPDGSVTPIIGSPVILPTRPGVYFVRRDAARAGAVVVAPEPAESELVMAAPATALRGLVSGRDVVTMTASAPWRRAVFDRAAGQALLLPLLLLALLALMAEGWISGR